MTAKHVITPGEKFTKLTAIEEVSPDLWKCLCDCGNTKVLSHRNLIHKDSKSCGCLLRQYAKKTHGHASEFTTGKKSPIYRVWKAMKERCSLKTSKNYARYGARGIVVCDRWHDFVNFLADMGEVPAGMSIDRIDSSGNYEPSNCRWATATTQARNRSITKKLEHLGVVRPLAEWSEITGINYKCLSKRLATGWTADRALTTPMISHQELSALGGATRWAKERTPQKLKLGDPGAS